MIVIVGNDYIGEVLRNWMAKVIATVCSIRDLTVLSRAERCIRLDPISRTILRWAEPSYLACIVPVVKDHVRKIYARRGTYKRYPTRS